MHWGVPSWPEKDKTKGVIFPEITLVTLQALFGVMNCASITPMTSPKLKWGSAIREVHMVCRQAFESIVLSWNLHPTPDKVCATSEQVHGTSVWVSFLCPGEPQAVKSGRHLNPKTEDY